MKRKNAYFTVEAALVLPMVLGAILFVVYLLMFQYDRCLLEQDMGELAVWISLQEDVGEQLVEELEYQMGDIYWDKYLAWEMINLDAKIRADRCVVSAGGQLIFPLSGWNFWNDKNTWIAETEWDFQNLHPVEFVRMCNKLKK